MTNLFLQPLELLTGDEIKVLVSILNEDIELRKWLQPNRADFSPITSDEFISTGKEWMRQNNAYIYCIITDKPIGTVSISHITKDGRAGIGYWITSAKWHKGFGAEAFGLTLEKANQMGIREVSAEIDRQNVASIALWEKHGAIQEAIGHNRLRFHLTTEGDGPKKSRN